MILTRTFALLLSIILLTIAAGAQESTPKGWKKVTACGFSFLLPERARQAKTYHVDSCLAAFEYKDIFVNLDYGMYSEPMGPQDWMKDYSSRSVTLNGRRATLITYDNVMHPEYKRSVTRLHMVTSKGGTPNNYPSEVALLMSIESKSVADGVIVKRIYESVKFIGK